MKPRWIALAFTMVASIVALVLFLRFSDDGLAEMLASEDTGTWVSILDPARAAPGYTLVLYRDRVPALMDLEGRVVHSWPKVRAVGRARMVPAGHPRAGQVVVFNNGLGDRESYRRSQVRIFDPQTLEKVWEYGAPFFYSSVSGVAQPL